MIWTLLVIYWVILVPVIASALLFRNYQNHEIIGVTLSKEHSKTAEVQEIQKSYGKACYTLLLVFFSLGLLMLLTPLKPFVDFYMMFLIFFLFITIGVVNRNYQNKLRILKEKNHWIYSLKQTVVVDTEASKEKGKSAVPIFWSWIFVILSLFPTIYLILNPEVQKLYPILFSLIGPVCQLLMVFLYRQALGYHTPALSDNSEINKACARTQEHINSMAATLTGLVMLLFWFLFNASMIDNNHRNSVILAVVVMIISLLAIAIWQQKKIRLSEEYFFESKTAFSNNEDQEIYEQGNLWKWGFYNNPDDPRLFVPKRVASMGSTINVGRPIGKGIMIGTFVFIIGLLLLVFVGAMTDYEIEETNSQITITSTMYSSTFDVNDILSIEKISQIPNSTRTNGFGGVNKSFGHFQVTGYGPCMFYLYNDTKQYIVIELKGKGPQYVFINDKTLEKTEELYDYLEALKK